MASSRYAVVLAAGKGTRFHSSLPKVLHPIVGAPMLEHVLNQLKRLNITQTFVVVGHQANVIQRCFLNWSVEWVSQIPQLGTAHAVSMTEPLIAGKPGSVIVLHGDCPLITSERLNDLISVREDSKASLSMITSYLEDPSGYGRVIRENDKPLRIVEEKNATREQKEIHEVNPAYYCFDLQCLFPALKRVSNDNEQKEYLLTDVVGILGQDGMSIETVLAPSEEIMGVNDRQQLALAKEILEARIK